MERGNDVLSDRLRDRMRELGLSQSELARRSGLSPTIIGQLLRGDRGPGLTVATMFKLKAALRVPYSFFDPENVHTRTRKDGTTEEVVGAEV